MKSLINPRFRVFIVNRNNDTPKQIRFVCRKIFNVEVLIEDSASSNEIFNLSILFSLRRYC